MTDSPYLKEAKRLAHAYADAKLVRYGMNSTDPLSADPEQAFAELLAHLQQAERKLGEVPMPEPVAYGFGNTAITGHTNRLMMVRIDIPGGDQYAGAFWLPLVLADEAHTYGVACRAAGEAAGYARGLADAGRDAERRGQFLVECNDVALRIDPFGYGIYDAIDGDGEPYQSQALADEIAALRGRKKP